MTYGVCISWNVVMTWFICRCGEVVSWLCRVCVRWPHYTDLPTTCVQLATCYVQLEEYEQAHNWIEKAKEIWEKQGQDEMR